MCTLILGLGILGPGSLLLGANRDESPLRPSAEPAVLLPAPRVVGGRDLVSGGTWLAIREARFVTALMNRRPVAGDARDPATLRSRGLLCLETAAGGNLEAALTIVRRGSYAPCTLVGVGVDGEAWALEAGAGEPSVQAISLGWHVITHRDLDDPDEPRTKWILGDIRPKRPDSPEEALELMAGYLRSHGEGGRPPVCLHRDVFPTVSSSLVALAQEPGAARYLHAPGPPCVTEYRDMTDLLNAEGG
ncbi:MAG TPA: NRDE family protein [Candidatus Limnocylindrales bacterium]|nr:NRDE family protein [Candidatus Limnocylindrales bacterium]